MNAQARVFTYAPPVLLAVALLFIHPAHWDAVRVVGLVLIVVGVGLLSIARAQLGNSFSITPQARALVTTGLYRRIRNPVYVFGFVAIVGMILYAGIPKLLWILAVLIPVQIVRVRAEARTLEEKFGEEYRAWRRTTWF